MVNRHSLIEKIFPNSSDLFHELNPNIFSNVQFDLPLRGYHLTYAIASITTTACSIIFAITADSATTDIAVVAIVVVGCTATTTSSKIKHATSYCSIHLICPSAGSKPNAVPKSSCASPFSSYEYLNKACFGTL